MPEPKKRILFVDDEPNVLAGLRRQLRVMRKDWEMGFASSAAEALVAFAERPFDVVVSDIQMPGMDGVRLLAQIMERYPSTARIALSGRVEREQVLRTVGPVHQYLSKPCEPATLRATIGRACQLQGVLGCEELGRLVARLETLPSLPDLYLRLVEEIESPNCSMERVGRIVSQDMAMTAKLLQLVSSSFFGLRCKVRDPVHAAVLLGADTVSALVLSAKVFSTWKKRRPGGLLLDQLWQHSSRVGEAARVIARREGAAEEVVNQAFLAGVMHDLGKLVLAANLPSEYRRVTTALRKRGAMAWAAEREVFGACHGEVGAYLLNLWGLPDPVVEALAYHNRPRECLHQSFGVLAAVHAANALVKEGAAVEESLDREFLEGIGLTDRLDDWICELPVS